MTEMVVFANDSEAIHTARDPLDCFGALAKTNGLYLCGVTSNNLTMVP
jgi:hypothetical protein